jgi:hypothetical protein
MMSEPILNSPFGTTIISGQVSQSLINDPGFGLAADADMGAPVTVKAAKTKLNASVRISNAPQEYAMNLHLLRCTAVRPLDFRHSSHSVRYAELCHCVGQRLPH